MSTPVRSGKVRDIYEVDDQHLLLVASDRVSTYDVVHPTPVPDKGRVLTGLSAFWFERLEALTPHHLVSAHPDDLPDDVPVEEFAGRSMLVRRLQIVPFECVVRGYLVGSGWKEYRQRGSVCGVDLPDGLVEADRLPTPIFTPTTKADEGHDAPVTFEEMAQAVGDEVATRLRDTSVALYEAGADLARERGIILADTKFEFGRDADGELVLADEVLTPDSSRYWPADAWSPGATPPSFDKQFVRDFAASTGWDKTPPAPELPDEIVARTRSKYVEAYERITGLSFADWYGVRA